MNSFSTCFSFILRGRFRPKNNDMQYCIILFNLKFCSFCSPCSSVFLFLQYVVGFLQIPFVEQKTIYRPTSNNKINYFCYSWQEDLMLWLNTFSIIRLFKSYNSHFVGNKAEEYGIRMHYIRFVDFLVGRFNTCWSFGAYSESESSICKSLVGRPSVNNMIRGAMQCSCIHVACPTLKHTKRKKTY